MKICIGLLALPLGYIIIRDLKSLMRLNISILISSFIILLYWYLANQYQIGDFSYIKSYSNQILMGLGDGKLYTAGLCSFVLPYITKFDLQKKKYNIFIYVLYFCLFLYALFSLRRTVLVLIVFGIMVTFIKDFRKTIKISLIVTLLLILLFPFISEQLETRFELRGDRIFSSAIRSEVRMLEPKLVLDEFNKEGISMVFFGKELFNSSGNYANGLYRDRMLHIDYVHILFSSGILGLFAYFLVFIHLYKKFYYMKSAYLGRNKKELEIMFKYFFLSSFIISLSGQMYEITFRSIIFIYLGGILGIYSNYLNYSQNEK